MIDIVNGLRRIAEEGYRFAGDAADEIERLRASLKAAEKERDDVAQQLVQSEITRREISEAHNAVTRRLSVLAYENTTLRAKIAEMEKQEPVAWYSKQYGFVYMSRHSSQFEHGSILYLRNGTPAWRIEGSSIVALLNMASLPHGTVFYALPGAKGE